MSKFHIAGLMLDNSCMMQGADVQLEQAQRARLLQICFNLLRPLLNVCMTTTDLHDDSDLTAEAIGAMIRIIKQPTLLDSMPDIVYEALRCLYYLTSVLEGKQQALQLLTVDDIEHVLSAALMLLEDDSRPDGHKGTTVGKATSAHLCVSKPNVYISAE